MSIITNFILNDAWTFNDKKHGISLSGRFVKFHVVSLVGMGINWGVFAVLFMGFGVFDIVSALAGIAAATLWNYFVNFRWTWEK
jgi:dolichol-phosphate mannosyltransferase